MPVQTKRFPCPKCRAKLYVSVLVEVETVTTAEGATTFSVPDISPVRCAKCLTYWQVSVSDMYVGYALEQLKIA